MEIPDLTVCLGSPGAQLSLTWAQAHVDSGTPRRDLLRIMDLGCRLAVLIASSHKSLHHFQTASIEISLTSSGNERSKSLQRAVMWSTGRSHIGLRWTLWGCYFQPGNAMFVFFDTVLVPSSALLVLFSAMLMICNVVLMLCMLC